MYSPTLSLGGTTGVCLSFTALHQYGDQDEIPYHEIGESYRVVRVLTPDPVTGAQSYQLFHEYNPMTIREGDVYFRRHAVNFPLNSGAGYQSIINAEGSLPLFSNYYLESKTFNDNIVGANSTDKGRIKVVEPGASEIRRYASVIFSDQDNYTDTQLRLNSFDATKAPFKDLPNSYGSLPFSG